MSRSAPASAAAAAAATESHLLSDEMLARQLQRLEDSGPESDQEGDPATARAASSSDDRAAARDELLRQICNEPLQVSFNHMNVGRNSSIGASSNGDPPVRRLLLGLEPRDPGDELGFFVSRVAGQQNRCAISLGVVLSGNVQRAILVNCQPQFRETGSAMEL
jgi:hypothetical protein